VIAGGAFAGRKAPCGRWTDGEEYEDRDDEVLLSRETAYPCGCRAMRHEYHDGSVSRTIVRHDRAVLVDELLSAQ
jgi:hypothetical protein